MKPQTYQEVERVLREYGAVFDRSKGDHFCWRMPSGKTAVVPHPKHPIPIGTLLNIYRQAGLR